MKIRRSHVLTVVTRLCVLSALIALWYLVTPRPLPELIFPSPSSVVQAATSLGPDLITHAAVTLGRVTLGWAIGACLGILMGLVLYASPIVRLILHPLIEGIRPLPPIALIPFFIIWFGLSLAGQLILIALGSFMVLTVNTFTAARLVPTAYLRAATALVAPRRKIHRTILLPAILPSLIGGLRIAAALAFGLGIAGEFMGAQSGLGFLMMVARRTLNTNTILLGVIIVGIESYTFDAVLRAVGRYLTRWTESSLEGHSTTIVT
jgi:taurine transport system permease protein